MNNEQINLGVKGWVTIKGIKPDGKEITLVDQPNALVDNARTMMAYLLGRQPSYSIDKIDVYKASGLLATSSFLTVTFPDANQVKFTTRFSESSFNDTLDELRLGSAIGGDFSVITDLSVLKGNTLQLQVEWLLTINIAT